MCRLKVAIISLILATASGVAQRKASQACRTLASDLVALGGGYKNW